MCLFGLSVFKEQKTQEFFFLPPPQPPKGNLDRGPVPESYYQITTENVFHVWWAVGA